MLKLLELFLNVGGNLPYLFNKRPGLDTQKLSFIHANQEGFSWNWSALSDECPEKVKLGKWKSG